MSAPFRLSLAQIDGGLSGVEARFGWLEKTLSEGRDGLGDLLLLPELFATGYNIGAEVKSLAEPRDGPLARRMAALAKAHRIALHYGYPERDGDVIYNAAQFFDADGKALGHHRKLALPPGWEREYFTPGAGISTFDYKGLTFATLICYDAEFPETIRRAAQNGAGVVLVPTALGTPWRWVSDILIPARAYENGVYLAYANSAGSERDLDYLGRSFIAAPDGVELARAESAPSILTAEIDPARIKAAQDLLPYIFEAPKLALD